jgi:hypothetical protein
MYDLSSTVISGQAALQKPKPYKPDREGREPEGEPQGSGGGAGGFATPPIIPPPGGGGGGGFSGGSISPGSSSHVTPVSPVTHVPGSNLPGTVVGGGGTGPILGGIGNSPVISPPTPGLPTPGPAPAPPPSGLGPVPGLIGAPSASGPPPQGGLPPGGLRSPQSGLIKPSTPAGPRMTMPSGGVIGANPGSGVIGQMPAPASGSRAPGPSRANPVGGVIGQQGSPRAGASAYGLPSQTGSLMGGQGRANGRRQDGEPERWDPDNPWSTEEGVDPVVLPPDDYGPIDPGPAIGYQR